jgi:hypothetical protein
MTREERDDLFDERLRALTVHDVSEGRADRTRERCRAVIAAHAARPRGPVGRFLAAAGRAFAAASWTEPLAALALSALYLVAAVAASMALLRLGPPR